MITGEHEKQFIRADSIKMKGESQELNESISKLLGFFEGRLSSLEKDVQNIVSKLNTQNKFQAQLKQQQYNQGFVLSILSEQMKSFQIKIEPNQLAFQPQKDCLENNLIKQISDQMKVLQSDQEKMSFENKKLKEIIEEINNQFKQFLVVQTTQSTPCQETKIITPQQNDKNYNDQAFQTTPIEIKDHQVLNQERLKIVQDLINDIYNQSCRKRSASGEFKKFIRDEQNLNQLYRNYGIRSSEMKSQLAEICNSFREARGDGNCFYTAFGFQYFNILLFQYSKVQYQEFISKMNDIITFKINYGEQKSIENQELQQQCWEELKYRLEYLRNLNDKEEFIKHFQAYEQSSDNVLIDGCFYGLSIIFFRNLANYLVDNSHMKQAVFDQQNLLIWEEECNSNEVIIDELAKYLQVHVKLVFFEQGAINLREYSQGMEFNIILLIRPGHYNIGYKNQLVQQQQDF